MRFVLPLAFFVVLIIVLAVGLTLDPRYVPSPLIDQAAPEFSLPSLQEPTRHVSNGDLAGRPVLLNVWASWCRACRLEHPLLVALARRKVVEIIGLNYKDEPRAARAWLHEHGDPYVTSIVDEAGSLGLDLGVYGVPETFLIDARGIIRYKHVGPLNQQVIDDELVPRLGKLTARGS